MSRSASDRPGANAQCGPYELLVRIGKGGMASVYLARRSDDERSEPALFALKVLHPHLGNESEFVDMLMDEAKIASKLRHPNAVSTLEIGRDGDRYFMVMDYVEGVALDRLLRRSLEERRPELIVPLAIDALEGLHAAHLLTDDLGRPLELVHRDVTPGNLIVGTDGVGRIADFGVAKARARITKTNPGVVKGKAGYIAPEVILGRDIDGRADVFSMGVLLWNALTGQTLFDTEDLASSLTALLKRDVPPPSTVGLMPPPIFDAPILGALHRDPKLRHESAAEMADALRDALLMLGGESGREPIGEWVRACFGEQLDKRHDYAARRRAHHAGELEGVDNAEPLSTSAMVRKDPTGRVISAFPRPLNVDEDDRVPESPSGSMGAGKITAIVVVAIVALLAAGFVGAYVATDGAVLGRVADPGTTASPPETTPAPAPSPPPSAEEDVEITPELFGGGAQPSEPEETEPPPADEPTPAPSRSTRPRPRDARRGSRSAPPPETTETVEPPTSETTPAPRPERGPATVVNEGVEYIAPPEGATPAPTPNPAPAPAPTPPAPEARDPTLIAP
ncbi:MAG: serine/threonine protein kinase [Sandaracinaceae bacterium]